jgi:flagellar biogenesis protein FliO
VMGFAAIQGEKPLAGGLVGFVMDAVQRGRSGLRGKREVKRMKVEETLSLGGRRQLMLVSCGERKYLVGAGSDGVQTIVAVEDDEVRR